MKIKNLKNHLYALHSKNARMHFVDPYSAHALNISNIYTCTTTQKKFLFLFSFFFPFKEEKGEKQCKSKGKRDPHPKDLLPKSLPIKNDEGTDETSSKEFNRPKKFHVIHYF